MSGCTALPGGARIDGPGPYSASRQFHGLIPAIGDAPTQSKTRYIFVIHGMGATEEGYSKPLIDAITALGYRHSPGVWRDVPLKTPYRVDGDALTCSSGDKDPPCQYATFGKYRFDRFEGGATGDKRKVVVVTYFWEASMAALQKPFLARDLEDRGLRSLVIVAFFVMAVQVFVVLIEFKIATLIGFALVPFGLFGRTAFMAERVLGAVIATGVKVMALAVVIGIGLTLFDQFVQTWQGGQPTLEQVLALVLASVVLLGLSIFCPGIASSLMSGAPQLGLGAAVGTGLTVGGMAVAGAALTQIAFGAGGGPDGPLAPTKDSGPPWRPPSAPAATPMRADDETAPSSKTARRAAQGSARGGAAADATSTAGASAAPEADGAECAPPQWARELKHRQDLAHGAGLTAHALASGDDHSAGASPSLSEN
jgi:hypothetical protein